MAEQDMIDAVQAYLDHHHIADRIEQVGQFQPRGTTGAAMAGGLIGSEAGDAFGGVASGIGVGLGAIAGQRANARSQGLPRQMLVGASSSMVYGFAMAKGRRGEPDELVFQVAREGLEVVVHARVNVRTLELVETATGARVELEGSRIPITHSHDLIEYLAGSGATDAADANAAALGESLDPSGS